MTKLREYRVITADGRNFCWTGTSPESVERSAKADGYRPVKVEPMPEGWDRAAW